MIGIKAIASYIPENRISNYDRKAEFEIDDSFICDKIGVQRRAVKGKDEATSDLCVKAFNNLSNKIVVNKSDISVLVVVTQNPDTNIPHTAAIVHGKLDLPVSCACFDISLGCSGYVYALSVIQSFMKDNDMKHGLLFTADPYSTIVDQNDKNTALLFGDAATVTLISDKPLYTAGKFTFGTIGEDYKELICIDKRLYMNGRAIFNFCAKNVPEDIHALLKENNLELKDIDKFIFHQGSRYMIDAISKRLKLDAGKVPFDMLDYGNTVSSSIPIILEKEMTLNENRTIVLSGFGVGLSWASGIIKRTEG